MSTETQQVLTPKMISQLQELIQVNIDSRDGFRHASEVTDDLTLQSAFEQIAIDRDAQADELARFVAWSGEYPRRDGSIAAAVHRAWMTIRESLSTDDRLAVLCEAERGEDSIKAAYEKALVVCQVCKLGLRRMRKSALIRRTNSIQGGFCDECEEVSRSIDRCGA